MEEQPAVRRRSGRDVREEESQERKLAVEVPGAGTYFGTADRVYSSVRGASLRVCFFY